MAFIAPDAAAVRAYLSEQGVAKTRMTPQGYADERPVADNGNEQGRQQNRRVEVQIAANQQLQQKDAAAAGGGGQAAGAPAGAQPTAARP